MSDLDEQFAQAQADVKTLTSKPSNDDMLRLYALYKQGSVGDASGKRPGMTDFVGRAKYDAWKKLEGTPQDTAKQDYIALVDKLLGR
jgi:diazepam-binding inhibitor (GABA receptor modulating acyl-CoA-binding protein)